MPRFVNAQFAPPGQTNPSNKPPPLITDFSRYLDSLRTQRSKRGVKIIAHEIQLVIRSLVRWVNSELCRWHRKDQPSVPCINCLELEHIAEKSADFFCLLRVDQRVHSGNHVGILSL